LPFTTIVNGTLFVGALFATNELIARGPLMEVVKAALVAAGPPHATINRVRQQRLERYVRDFMSQPVANGHTRCPQTLACPALLSARFSVEVAGCPNVSLNYTEQRLSKTLEVDGCLDRLDYL